jgi:Fe-S-cluster-containing hydrogenase component 2
MVKRKIIIIDEEKCDGCGLCVEACHEGAIQVEDGKARLVSETYCDGLGDCLSECPQDAIRIEEREAKPFDEKAVEAHLARQKKQEKTSPPVHGGCPGAALRSFQQKEIPSTPGKAGDVPTMLSHWPVQLMLIPPGAPFLKGADILVCADCVPFAVPDFHSRYLAGKAVLVGCPKLDDLSYYEEKLKAIFGEAKPRSLTVLKMQVPCCAGIAHAAVQARNETARGTAIKVHTIGLQGEEIFCEKVPEGQLTS